MRYWMITMLWACSYMVSMVSVADSTSASLETLVIDIRVTGDSSVSGDVEDDLHKIALFSEQLRQSLQADTRLDVINNTDINVEMAAFSQTQNLHTCNRCDIQFAESKGAQYLLKPSVFRMSRLISTLHIEIVSVETGRLVFKKAYDFRGTTDEAWSRAIRYAVRDIANWPN